MRATSQTGTNAIEMMCFILIIYGAVFGGLFGYKHFGGWGVVVGIPAGIGVGLLAGFVVTFILAVVCKALFGGTLFKPRKTEKDKP
jgi:hypothetical protein